MKTLADIQLSTKDREAIKAAADLLRSRFPVTQVVLFGSKARGTDDPESDIDLLVITSRLLSWRERDSITDALFDLELSHDVVISTLVVFQDDWENGPWQVVPIRSDIERDGAAA